MLFKKTLLFILWNNPKHTAVLHIVAIDYGYFVRKIVTISIVHENRTADVIFSVYHSTEVIIVIICLHNRIVYWGIFTIEPANYIGI